MSKFFVVALVALAAVAVARSVEVDRVDWNCMACKMGATFAQDAVRNHTTKITEYVEEKCEEVLGKFASHACPIVMDKLDDMLQYVEVGLKPEEVCQMVRLCPVPDKCRTEVSCTCCPSQCGVKVVC